MHVHEPVGKSYGVYHAGGKDMTRVKFPVLVKECSIFLLENPYFVWLFLSLERAYAPAEQVI